MHHTRDSQPGLRYARSQRSYVDLEFATYRHHRDARSFARVIAATSHRLVAAARSCTSDPHVAEELVQSTYVAALHGARAYDSRHPLVPWMIGILYNRARRARKLEKRQPDPCKLAREVPLRDPRDDLVGREIFESTLR